MPITSSDRNLPDWLTRVRTGQTKLPRFQRWEAWGHGNVTALFNTILQDLPAGSVLILQVGDKEPFPSRLIEGVKVGAEKVTEHLLDGQQRLTALWRGLNNNYDERTYFLHLSKDEETGMPYFIDSVPRRRRKSDDLRVPLWADDPASQWQRRMIPLDVLAPTPESNSAYMKWASEAIEDVHEQLEILNIAYEVRGKFAAFNLPYLALPTQTEPHTALEVFIRTNTSAEPLGDYDIVVALAEASTGESLHEFVAKVEQASPAASRYYPSEDLALAAAALLQRRVAGKSTYLSDGFTKRLIGNWNKYQVGVDRAVAFFEQERIFDANRLPTDVVVPVLVALWAEAPKGGDAEGRARSILRKYMWRAFFTRRYERGTGTRALADYNELRAYVASTSAPKPAIFNDEANPLPEIAELMEAGWPKKKDRLGRAILALSLRRDGLDLADGSQASVGNLSEREYHHLFPAAHLKGKGVPDGKIYRALNCALVSWKTNRTISSKEPEKYLAEREVEDGPTKDQIKARLSSHLIPYQQMVANDYDAFMEKRGEMVQTEMLKLCS